MKLANIIIQILRKMLAISNEANTSLGSSRKLMILLAAGCCFVFSTFTSLSFKEKIATSAPEIVKLSKRRSRRRITRKVVPCVLAASNICEKSILKKPITE
jgi:hypothetical protein